MKEFGNGCPGARHYVKAVGACLEGRLFSGHHFLRSNNRSAHEATS